MMIVNYFAIVLLNENTFPLIFLLYISLKSVNYHQSHEAEHFQILCCGGYRKAVKYSGDCSIIKKACATLCTLIL